QLVNGAGELRHMDAERGIVEAFGKDGQHDQSRHDEGTVTDPADVPHAWADGGADHHEVEYRRDHGRYQALPERAPETGHLEPVDGQDAVVVEAPCFFHVAASRSLTSPTKISSRLLWRVLRSLNSMPRSCKRRSRVGISVCSCPA